MLKFSHSAFLLILLSVSAVSFSQNKLLLRPKSVRVPVVRSLASDAPTVVSSTPAMNATDAALTTDASAVFSVPMNPSTLTQSSVHLYGERSGKHTGTVTYNPDDNSVTLNPDRDFVFGESIQATITNAAVSADGTPLAGGHSWKFNTGVIYGTGDFTSPRVTFPNSVAASVVAGGDFNGDGYTDYVAAGPNGSFEIFINTKKGGFTSIGTFSSGASAGSPLSIAVADVNGDGSPDIIIANAAADRIGIALNNGSGRFPTAASYAAGASPVSLSIADVTNDGSLDIAVTNSTANSVTILKNSGSGTFSITQTIPVGSGPSGIVLEDFNSDGLMDAAVCIKNTDSVTLLKNLNGDFAVDTSYAVGHQPVAICAYDFDKDGLVDIAVVNAGSNDVYVYLNTATGQLYGPGVFPLGGGLQPVGVCGNDFDGDGDTDIAVTCAGTNDVVIMLNNGYSFPTLVPVPVGNGPVGIASVDVSGRYGIMDLVVANTADGTVSLLKNNFFSPPPAELTGQQSSLHFPATAIGASSSTPVRVYSSITPLQIDSVTSPSGVFASETVFPITLASYDSVDLPITFGPRAYGDAADDITIYSTAGTLTIQCSGTSPLPSPVTSRSSIAFGNSLRAVDAVRTFTVKNASVNPLTVDSVYTKTRWYKGSITKHIVNGITSGTDSLIVSVKFTPDAFLSYTDTLFIVNNSASAVIAVPLSGICPAPVLTMSTQELSFGTVKVGSTSSLAIMFRNDSFNLLTLDSIKATAQSMYSSVGTIPAVLRTNDSLRVSFIFTPTRFGTFRDSLRVYASTGVRTVIVSGSSPTPVFVSTASALTFGDCLRGTTTTKTVVIRNSSLNTLSLDSVYTRTRWMASSHTKGSINTGDSLTLTVSFTPDLFQSYNDTLVIVNNSETKRIAIPLTGNSPAPVLSVSASSLSFGSTVVGSLTRRQFLLRNSSFNTITVDSVTTASGSMFAPSAIQQTALRTNDSLIVTIAFTPKSFAQFVDTVRIHTILGIRTVVVDGSSPSPSIALSTNAIAFGNCLKGSLATQKIVIRNASINTFSIDTLYARTRWFMSTLTKGTVTNADSLIITVMFMPDAFQTYTDTLFILNNSNTKRIAVPLTGNSPAPVLTASAASIAFGTIRMRTTVRKDFQLVNSSFNTIAVDSIRVSNKAFTITSLAPAIVKTNDTLRATVAFTPDSLKKYVDTIFVYSSTLTAVLKIPVTGDGDNGTYVAQLGTGLPDTYSLSQNFPNPFNPSTVIQFAVPKQSHVTVAVYDVTGREVAVLFNDDVGAGFYSTTWNASGASSGIYFYRLSSGAYVETKKLLLLK